MTKKLFISASRISTFQKCSQLYAAKYLYKLPDKSNLGSLMGTACHAVFECLSKSRRKKTFDIITKEKATIQNSPAVTRYIRSYMKKFKLPDECFDKMDSMIVVGLLTDFFCHGTKMLPAEMDFKIENEDPKYAFLGFIDRAGIKNDKEIIIRDWKSSKQKYEGGELVDNIQAFCYALAARHLWPHLKPIVQFVFLQFPEDPIAETPIDPDRLNRFEKFLSITFEKMENFTEEDATSNLAASKGFPAKGEGFVKKLLCGFSKSKEDTIKKDGTPKFSCAYKWSFDFFQLCAEDGTPIKSSYENDLIPNVGIGEFVIKKHYAGCPSFNRA